MRWPHCGSRLNRFGRNFFRRVLHQLNCRFPQEALHQKCGARCTGPAQTPKSVFTDWGVQCFLAELFCVNFRRELDHQLGAGPEPKKEKCLDKGAVFFESSLSLLRVLFEFSSRQERKWKSFKMLNRCSSLIERARCPIRTRGPIFWRTSLCINNRARCYSLSSTRAPQGSILAFGSLNFRESERARTTLQIRR